MSSNLTLVTTESFGNVDCNFYKDNNNKIFLTREQIGQALEYTDPSKAISKIHSKHKDRLDDLCIRIKDKTIDCHQSGDGRNGNLITERVYYTERGVMEICRWSRQSKANMFMDWVWDIVGAYRSNSRMLDDINSDSIRTLTESISALKSDIQEIKDNQLKYSPRNQRRTSSWYVRMCPKYKMLTEFFGCTRKELYSSIYKELEDTYDVDINAIHEDYCYENNLLKDECFIMDAIEHNDKLRNGVVKLIDESLIKYGLQTPEQLKKFKRKTLFDR